MSSSSTTRIVDWVAGGGGVDIVDILEEGSGRETRKKSLFHE
jgi:hypothetical protein